jgi:hypothetical protein
MMLASSLGMTRCVNRGEETATVFTDRIVRSTLDLQNAIADSSNFQEGGIYSGALAGAEEKFID